MFNKFLTALLTVLSLSTCTPDQSVQMSLIISGNNRIKLEPCGCKIPIGGLGRKITYIKQMRQDLPGMKISAIEAGNWLFHKADNVQPREASYLKILADLQAKAYSDVGYDVIHNGYVDYALGLEYLKELQRNYDLPFMSSNVLDKNGNSPFPTYRIIESGGKRVLVTGVIAKPPALNESITLSDPVESLTHVIEARKGSYDFCIVLLDGPESTARQINKSVRGVDVILNTRTARQTMMSQGLGHTSYLTLGQEGKYLGNLELTLGGRRQARDMTPIVKKLDFIEQRLQTYRKNVPEGQTLEDYYGSRGAVLKQIEKYEDSQARDQARLDSTQAYFVWDVVAMDKKFDGEPEIDHNVQAIKQEFQSERLGFPQPVYSDH